MMKATFLIVAFSILLFSCQPEKTASESTVIGGIQKSEVQTINASAFKNLSEKDNTIVLDVRTPEEVAGGKIPNAVVINIYDSDFESKVKQLDKEKAILIYCSAGVRSQKAAEFLTEQGYPSVYHLEGGLGDWYRNGFPLEK